MLRNVSGLNAKTIRITLENHGSYLTILTTSNLRMNKFTLGCIDCGRMDLESGGPRFTWVRQVGGRTTTWRRLDSVLWNMEAQLDIPKDKALVLPRVYSDHNPILFMDSVGDAPPRNKRPFRFETAWLMREDYDDIWINTWRNTNVDFMQGINDIVTKSKHWNTNTFGNIFRGRDFCMLGSMDSNNRSIIIIPEVARILRRSSSRISVLFSTKKRSCGTKSHGPPWFGMGIGTLASTTGLR